MTVVTHDIILKFAHLFHGRLDAYGTEVGGCEHSATPTWESYIDRVYAHLIGSTPMGVYPMVPNMGSHVVRWGCVDFDEGVEVSFVHAMNLKNTLDVLGVKSFVERSRSKGYHVWVFVDGHVAAVTMRRALLGATQIAQAPLKEINPKSEFLVDGKIGNYVRLPYPQGCTERRIVVDDNDNRMRLSDFVTQASNTLTSPKLLEELTSLWQPPVKAARPKQHNHIRQATFPDSPVITRISGLARTIITEGPLEGSDRSGTLWRLANILLSDGLDRDEAASLLYLADETWGKYAARGDLRPLEKMLDEVYSE
jgi:hypothetical protein